MPVGYVTRGIVAKSSDGHFRTYVAFDFASAEFIKLQIFKNTGISIMNKFTVAALGITLAFGAILPSVAQTTTQTTTTQTTTTTNSMSGQPITGKVEKSEVTVQFPENQTESYQVDPALLTAMNLTEGSTVNFSSRKLGTITNVSRYGVTVEFANGDTESYLLTEEGRRTLTFGDRVVVTPDLQLARAENYVLTAADIQVPTSSMMASTSSSTSSGTMSQPMPSSTMPTTPPSSSMSVPDTTSPSPSEPAATPSEPERMQPSNPSDPMASPSTPDTAVPNTPKTPRGPNTPGSVLKP
jgi:hypothetical protein